MMQQQHTQAFQPRHLPSYIKFSSYSPFFSDYFSLYFTFQPISAGRAPEAHAAPCGCLRVRVAGVKNKGVAKVANAGFSEPHEVGGVVEAVTAAVAVVATAAARGMERGSSGREQRSLPRGRAVAARAAQAVSSADKASRK